ncbi:Uncharacterised protein [Mycobacterium tuberculosis]|nr:Uncharacterised protein [Mycobacterium tuberculosis]
MGSGELLKLVVRNPGPRNSEHSLPDSTAVMFSIPPICVQPGNENNSWPPQVGFAKFISPKPPTMLPVSAL